MENFEVMKFLCGAGRISRDLGWGEQSARKQRESMGKAYGKGFSFFTYLSFPPFLGRASLSAKQPPPLFPGSPFSPCTTRHSTDGGQAGKDAVKLVPAVRKRWGRALGARGGAQLPAAGLALGRSSLPLLRHQEWGQKPLASTLLFYFLTSPPRQTTPV